MKHMPNDCEIIERNGITFLAHPRRRYDPVTTTILLAGAGGFAASEMLSKKSGGVDIPQASQAAENAKKTAPSLTQDTEETLRNKRLRASLLTQGFASDQPTTLSRPGLLG